MTKEFLIKENSERKVYIEYVDGDWELIEEIYDAEDGEFKEFLTTNPTFEDVERAIKEAECYDK